RSLYAPSVFAGGGGSFPHCVKREKREKSLSSSSPPLPAGAEAHKTSGGVTTSHSSSSSSGVSASSSEPKKEEKKEGEKEARDTLSFEEDLVLFYTDTDDESEAEEPTASPSRRNPSSSSSSSESDQKRDSLQTFLTHQKDWTTSLLRDIVVSLEQEQQKKEKSHTSTRRPILGESRQEMSSSSSGLSTGEEKEEEKKDDGKREGNKNDQDRHDKKEESLRVSLEASHPDKKSEVREVFDNFRRAVLGLRDFTRRYRTRARVAEKTLRKKGVQISEMKNELDRLRKQQTLLKYRLHLLLTGGGSGAGGSLGRSSFLLDDPFDFLLDRRKGRDLLHDRKDKSPSLVASSHPRKHPKLANESCVSSQLGFSSSTTSGIIEGRKTSSAGVCTAEGGKRDGSRSGNTSSGEGEGSKEVAKKLSSSSSSLDLSSSSSSSSSRSVGTDEDILTASHPPTSSSSTALRQGPSHTAGHSAGGDEGSLSSSSSSSSIGKDEGRGEEQDLSSSSLFFEKDWLFLLEGRGGSASSPYHRGLPLPEELIERMEMLQGRLEEREEEIRRFQEERAKFEKTCADYKVMRNLTEEMIVRSPPYLELQRQAAKLDDALIARTAEVDELRRELLHEHQLKDDEFTKLL
ncbi:zinc c3hc4 type (ring finger) domain-containing protein, partial [Cystoisospora suis]